MGFVPHQDLSTDDEMHEHAHMAAVHCVGLMTTSLYSL